MIVIDDEPKPIGILSGFIEYTGVAQPNEAQPDTVIGGGNCSETEQVLPGWIVRLAGDVDDRLNTLVVAGDVLPVGVHEMVTGNRTPVGGLYGGAASTFFCTFSVPDSQLPLTVFDPSFR